MTVKEFADKLREFDPNMEIVNSEDKPLEIEKTTGFHSAPDDIPKVRVKTGYTFKPYTYSPPTTPHKSRFDADDRITHFYMD
jgi:hypothetical protein